MYISNTLPCSACFKYGHHERSCKPHGGDELCRRFGITGVTRDETRYTNEIKSNNCGEAHTSTSRSCKIWKNEKEIVTIKYRKGLSFPEARKIVEARYNLSFLTVLKTNKASSIELQTHTNDASVQTVTPKKLTETNVKTLQKQVAYTKPEKPLPKGPKTSQIKVLLDRLPKGSDDQMQQHNRFQRLDEDM